MAKIGYAKIGRSFNLDPAKATSVGGDIDVLNCLRRLAEQFPEHEFVLVGKNSGENPQAMGYPANVTNPWTDWKERFVMVPDPKRADVFIDGMRELTAGLENELEAFVVWAGQHGSANSRIPMIGSDWLPGQSPAELFPNEVPYRTTGGVGSNLATPQYAFIHYVSWLLDFIARWREGGPGPLRREEIWLCPDPRNYLKCREMRWPVRYPILAQYDFLRYHKAERYGRFPEELTLLDPTGYREDSRWVSNLAYRYSGLELTAVAAPGQVAFDARPGPHRFGVVLNENLVGGADSRRQVLEQWLLPNFPDIVIRGHWTEKTQLALHRAIEPVPYPEVAAVMKSFATTLTTPASSSEWATAKPWEAFALGSVCFFHPRYDGQGHILPVKDAQPSGDTRADTLADFLRVRSAEDLVEKVDRVLSQPELYHVIATEQRRHYEKRFSESLGGTLAIRERILHDLFRDTEDYRDPGSPWLEKTEPVQAKVTNRGEARPRGTNEERKRKPPVSRRRKLRPDQLEEQPTVADDYKQPTGAFGAFDTAKTLVTPAETILVAGGGGGGFSGPFSVPPAVSTVTLVYGGGAVIEPLNFTGSSVRATTGRGPRTSKDRYFLDMAKHVATQSTCARRAVGCVLVDVNKKVLATGFNGVPRGFDHCNEGHPCPGASAPSGENLDGCYSAHAEMNALIQCSDVMAVQTAYLTLSPCVSCVKSLLNSGATRIVFDEEYVQPAARELWLRRPGNEWIKL